MDTLGDSYILIPQDFGMIHIDCCTHGLNAGLNIGLNKPRKPQKTP